MQPDIARHTNLLPSLTIANQTLASQKTYVRNELYAYRPELSLQCPVSSAAQRLFVAGKNERQSLALQT